MTTHPHDTIALNAGALAVGYCRACGAWRVSCGGHDEQVHGHGLAAYREFIDTLGGRRSDLEFLRVLGGHEHEVER